MTIKVPIPKFIKMQSMYSGQSIAEEGRALDYTMLNNRKHIVTSTLHKANTVRPDGVNADVLSAFPVIPLSEYRDELEPLTRNDHWLNVGVDGRERSYEGMSISIKGEQHVVCGKVVNVEFQNSGQQASLF